MFSKEDYYEQFYVPRTYKEIRRLITGNGKQAVFTNESIDFKLIPFNSTLKKAVKILGKPKYTLNNGDSIAGHEVLFYKYIIGGYKTVTELHFIDKHFFLGQYLFNETDSSRFESVKKLLFQKYLLSAYEDMDSFILQDASSNKIDVQDISFGVISYISGNPALLNRFETNSNVQPSAKPNAGNNTLDQLYDNL